MITEKKLADYLRHYKNDECDGRCDRPILLIETLALAWKVIRAAQKVDAYSFSNGDESNEILNLREALAPFNEPVK